MAKDSNKKEDLRALGFNPSIYFNSYAMGGALEEGTPDLSAYETTYGELPPEVEHYMRMPGVNPDKVLAWFNLGINEPQTYNQAKLLAEAVGYNPEQAKVVAGQWQMESSGGSRLSSAYNYFGIKSHNEAVRNKLAERGIDVTAGKEADTTEGKGKKIKSSFMEFKNAFEGFAAHRAFLETNPRYQKALAAPTAKDFAVGLQKAGYATGENYGIRLYNDYVKPKELNPKSGDTRPKSLGETKSEKIKPFAVSQASSEESVGKLPLLVPQRLEEEPKMNLEPTIAEGMYGSVPYQQKVDETTPIPMDAPRGFFGSGKTIFKQGGSMNFKSPGAYHKWLGYVHATGLAESTPGNQKVSIGGQPHKVEHEMGGNLYAAGGGIHINPANKGKFTASAKAAGMGVQEFASHVLANKEDYSTTQVRRANFAHNAAGWKHELGGPINPIQSHYSIPDTPMDQYGGQGHLAGTMYSYPTSLPYNYGGHMMANGGFNNPGFKSLPVSVQNKIKARSFADGGTLGNQLTEFSNGGSHEENPLGGIPQGVAPDGKMNLVEQGETKLDSANYIFSDNLKVTKDVAEAFNLPTKLINNTYSEASKKLNLNSSRREGDTIEDNYKKEMLDKLMEAQEQYKQEEMQKDFQEMAEKYPQQMAALMQNAQGMPDQGGQMGEVPPGELAAAGINPGQEAGSPQPEPVTASQLPMSYGGSMYMCGGKMYADGGWFDDHSGAMSGAASGAMSGASAGAFLGPWGMAGGALIGATIGGFKGNEQDQTKQQATQSAQNAQNMQNAANPNIGVAQAGMPIANMSAAPGSQNMYNYPSYNMSAYGDTSASGSLMRNGGNIPSYHQYPQINPDWTNHAGPMGQPVQVLYSRGGHIYDGESNSTGFMLTSPTSNYIPQANNLLANPWINNDLNDKYLLPTVDFTNTSNTGITTSNNSSNPENHYNVDPTLTDTTQDLSVQGTALQTLSELAPIGYNAYQAIKKPRVYKPSDFYTLQEAIRPDYREAYNEAKNTYAQIAKGLGQTGESGGIRAANLANAAFERNKAMGQIAMAEENAYLQDKVGVRAANAAAETAGKTAALQTNWATQAARQEHGKEAINQFKAMTEADLANKLATNYAIMGAPDISKFKKVGYTPYFEYLKNKFGK